MIQKSILKYTDCLPGQEAFDHDRYEYKGEDDHQGVQQQLQRLLQPQLNITPSSGSDKSQNIWVPEFQE
jgi:hypothetical protein